MAPGVAAIPAATGQGVPPTSRVEGGEVEAEIDGVGVEHDGEGCAGVVEPDRCERHVDRAGFDVTGGQRGCGRRGVRGVGAAGEDAGRDEH